ncbi:hypothetical protein [Priestia taiwanensis]|uniref:Uncharacterized protein n=1 Tax=Priestia taiwanensis TaxID=1347902 RepID=A0A917AU63_9BACI|nr:hypothetical protein [Priestia taiwanensis]MBM7363916.1 hypothetical protein [Priestia taiwanensis]GGE70075.1 hypothetical protein GCM10007140_20070 [Priestia taiwanensis]
MVQFVWNYIVPFFTSIQFFMTIIPVNYPSFWGEYSGMPSDVYQMMKLLKAQKGIEQ